MLIWEYIYIILLSTWTSLLSKKFQASVHKFDRYIQNSVVISPKKIYNIKGQNGLVHCKIWLYKRNDVISGVVITGIYCICKLGIPTIQNSKIFWMNTPTIYVLGKKSLKRRRRKGKIRRSLQLQPQPHPQLRPPCQPLKPRTNTTKPRPRQRLSFSNGKKLW